MNCIPHANGLKLKHINSNIQDAYPNNNTCTILKFAFQNIKSASIEDIVIWRTNNLLVWQEK